MEDAPDTQYTSLSGDRIAYQVLGEGDLDLVYLPPTGDSIEPRWEWPPYANYLRRLATFARLIMFDRRGSGISDSPSDESLPPWERWADDAQAVLDEVGSESAVIFGTADSGPTAILFAVAHPSRTRGLILGNTSARLVPDADYEGGIDSRGARRLYENWGTKPLIEWSSPDMGANQEYVRWLAKSQRQSIRPRELRELLRSESSLDVRQILPTVRVPTLVLHRSGYEMIPSAHGQYIADHIPGARFSSLGGRDGHMFNEPASESLEIIGEFLEGLQEPTEPDRALAAILFTDIVESTARASALGDREWRHLLETHDAVARTVVEQHKGKLIQLTGDGMLATFDGPGRAIRGAIALGDALRPLGIEIRAGIHTGEIEIRESGIAGIGVHIAARVEAAASPGELLVSPAVPMLVAGSGIEFDDRGEHELKGVPGAWRLFAVKG